jgi:acyl carrier protein
MNSDVAARDSRKVSAIDQVTAAWERVLLRTCNDVDAEFFDCGGDSLLALALLIEIENETGQELPITRTQEASTIAKMAALIDGAWAGGFSPLVCAKPGSGAPPLFLIHGGGGSAMQMTRLGQLIDHEGAAQRCR